MTNKKPTIYFRLNQAEFEESRSLPNYPGVPAYCTPEYMPLQTACNKIRNMNYMHITRFSIAEGRALYQFMKDAGKTFELLIKKFDQICSAKHLILA